MKKRQGRAKKKHYHLWDIPRKYFPRNTKAVEYVTDLMRLTSNLDHTNRRIQYSAQICTFNVKSINQKSKLFLPKPTDVFREMDEFVYHYENYCYRLYAYREKLLQFINAILPFGYSESQVRIEHIVINPIVRRAGIIKLIEKFRKNTSLNKLIQDRKNLTHKLCYENDCDHFLRPKIKTAPKTPDQERQWFNSWKKQITTRSQHVNICCKTISDINNVLAEKIISYKKSKP